MIMVPLAFIVFTVPFIDYVSLITRGRTYNMIDKKVEFTLRAAIAFHAPIQLQNELYSDSLSPLKVQSVTTVTDSGLAG